VTRDISDGSSVDVVSVRSVLVARRLNSLLSKFSKIAPLDSLRYPNQTGCSYGIVVEPHINWLIHST